MKYDLIRFSGILRENGIPASLRCTTTAYEALPLVKEGNGDLKEILAAIYLKDQRKRKKFDTIYESFFEGNRYISKGDLPKIQADPKNKIQSKGCIAGKNQDQSFHSKTKYIPFAQTMDHIKDSLVDEIKLDYIENTLGGSTSDNSENGADSNSLKSNLTDLNSLQPELIDLCQKMGKKIATKRVRRFKQSKKQKPDIRRTIRKNMKHGGAMLELVKSKPHIKKHNHYFLNDVSISCDWISLWFFCRVYASQHSFSNLRAFEFDNKTAEISSALQEDEVINAFLKVLEIRKQNRMINGKSNMHTAFYGFLNQANLNNKSYVMILSDCRDWAGPKHGKQSTNTEFLTKYGRKPLSADLIHQMSKDSKRVLILNPEPKAKWNVADSCVSYYEDAGAECFEVRDLEQLADLVSEI
ncbi:VWA domain-containing protein [Methanobacterium sp.]|uniref:VWA domain-containing protein n=1 Tax=Methanobacterium sp. TaxID=2164 RepID=UPI002AB9893E|nr:VWA domain-containing protein [Methanobacterium sp.]MDY9923865.1 VWA domain-containing protein [Methanobacterium sp.]